MDEESDFEAVEALKREIAALGDRLALLRATPLKDGEQPLGITPQPNT